MSSSIPQSRCLLVFHPLPGSEDGLGQLLCAGRKCSVFAWFLWRGSLLVCWHQVLWGFAGRDLPCSPEEKDNHLWLNISKWGWCRQKSFWIKLTNVQQGQNLSNSWKWPQMTFVMYSSGSISLWRENMVRKACIHAICYLFASLIHLQNEAFNCLKHGFLNSWNSNVSI